MRPRIGSLFSGVGGLTAAVEQVTGGDLAWYSEVDPAACRVLAERFPGVPNLGDVTAVDWAAVEPVDILEGGFPCQDISHAGKGAGIKEGTRSGLWFHFAAAIGVLRPRLVVLENVAAITAGGGGLDVVLASLAEIGFDAEWGCLPAAAVGACHRRDRWFCVAWPADADLPRLEGRHVGGHGGGERTAGPGGVALLPTPRSTDGPKGGPGQRNGRGVADSLPAIDALLPTPTSMDAKASGEKAGSPNVTLTDATVREVRSWGAYEAAITRHEAAVGRRAPSPTEPSPKTGKPRLSPAFVEWMMMLPQGWVTGVEGVTRNQALKDLGNAVVAPQAIAALELLLARIAPEVLEPVAPIHYDEPIAPRT